MTSRTSIFATLGRVALLHDAAATDGDAADRDVVYQMEAIEQAVAERGGKTMRFPVTLNMWELKRWIRSEKPGLVFNLVESLDRSDRLQTVVPLLLEDWRVLFTGSGSLGMLLSNNKLASKERLAESGLPVPDGFWADRRGTIHRVPENGDGDVLGDWIVKTLESHASAHMNDDSVVRNATAAELAGRIADLSDRHGEPFFAEQFIDGREFNLSLLENDSGGVSVLPEAEIRFDNLPAGKPAIVGYQAKWVEDSPEYAGTTRSFDFPPSDDTLRKNLKKTAIRCWRVIGLRGYARVDFRVDRLGKIAILEANANPCLSPDAGFAAAAERGGLSYGDMVERIALAALRR
ncbi:MAG: D-alanine--D-alanine ligase [Planctomycetes bacterium]|nr:D-alanine--D-alanine ligase [Planctomycetota bacterium]